LGVLISRNLALREVGVQFPLGMQFRDAIPPKMIAALDVTERRTSNGVAGFPKGRL